jgi:hypothetical protein
MHIHMFPDTSDHCTSLKSQTKALPSCQMRMPGMAHSSPGPYFCCEQLAATWKARGPCGIKVLPKIRIGPGDLKASKLGLPPTELV